MKAEKLGAHSAAQTSSYGAVYNTVDNCCHQGIASDQTGHITPKMTFKRANNEGEHLEVTGIHHQIIKVASSVAGDITPPRGKPEILFSQQSPILKRRRLHMYSDSGSTNNESSSRQGMEWRELTSNMGYHLVRERKSSVDSSSNFADTPGSTSPASPQSAAGDPPLTCGQTEETSAHLHIRLERAIKDDTPSSTTSTILAPELTNSSSSIPNACEPALTSSCRWQSCQLAFKDDTELFDHVVQIHLELLRPGCFYRNVRTKRGGCTSIDAERYRCRWSSCGLKMERGDEKKRFLWLEEHFTTRHSGRSLPYLCLIDGCKQRFSTKKLLEDHLRVGHDESVGNNSNCSSGVSSTSGSSAGHGNNHRNGYRRRLPDHFYFRPPHDPKMDYLDLNTICSMAEIIATSDASNRQKLMKRRPNAHTIDLHFGHRLPRHAHHGHRSRKFSKLYVWEVEGEGAQRCDVAKRKRKTVMSASNCRTLIRKLFPSKVR